MLVTGYSVYELIGSSSTASSRCYTAQRSETRSVGNAKLLNFI